MAVTRVGTETKNFAAQGTEWSSRAFSHTVPSGATLLVVSIALDATDPAISSVVWDSAGVNESFTLVHATTSSGSPGDVKIETWALVSPTAKTANITVTPNGDTVSQSSIGAVNYSGTVVSSVADATNFHEEQVGNTNVSDLTFSSAGTAGNYMYCACNFQDFDRDPVVVTGGLTKFLEVTDPTTDQEFILVIADGDAPDDCIMTDDASAGSDEAAGHLLEIVASAAASRGWDAIQRGNLHSSLRSR